MRQLETSERELGRPLTDAEQEALVEERFAPLRVAVRTGADSGTAKAFGTGAVWAVSEGPHRAMGRLQIGPGCSPSTAARPRLRNRRSRPRRRRGRRPPWAAARPPRRPSAPASARPGPTLP